MTIKFNVQQQRALKKVRRWLKDPSADPVFRLFGYAGTGKTTLARHIEEMAREMFKNERPTVYASYTGKAALVMQQKGCEDASTVHSLIYKPIIDHSTGRVIGYSRFNDSPLLSARYGTLDEVSMISEDQGTDLLAFARKLLVLGDPFQLPPPDPKYGDEGFFMRDGECDVMLTDIERQAKDDPLIYMMTEIREGRELKYGRYGDSRIMKPSSVTDEFYTQNDQLLCGKNITRKDLNAKVRRIKGHASPLPEKGDKLVCIKNDKKLGLLNGGTWKVTKLLSSDAKKFRVAMRSMDLFDEEGKGLKAQFDVLREQFDGGTDIDPNRLKGYGQFDWGELLTVHKGQGSQWGRVGIINESDVFREMADRHYYTALSRAIQQVEVVGR